MKIYTKQGDGGDTGLFGGRRVRKDNLRIETYGTVDELNSVLGVAAAGCGHASLRELLEVLQHQLFDAGGELATPADSPYVEKTRRVSAEWVALLERHIDDATAALPPLKRFILPGGGTTAAHLHLARTVCRRAERLAVTLNAEEAIGTNMLAYLNRLSDLLFVLARRANQLDGVADVEWEPAPPPPLAPRQPL